MTDGYEWAEANPDLFVRLTRATRAADKAHQSSGGGTRHWIRDCFIAALAEEELEIVASSVSAGAGQVPADTIKKALADIDEALASFGAATTITMMYGPHRDAHREKARRAMRRVRDSLAALAAVDAQETKT